MSTFALEMLEKIELMLLGKADRDVQNYSIKGRALQHYSIAELMLLRDQLKAEIKKEKLDKALAAKGVKRVKGIRYV